MAKKLGELLPANQAKLLKSETLKNLTQAQLEKALDNMAKSKLTVKEFEALRKLSVTRINAGETPFTWTAHKFSTDPKSDTDPNTCSCI